MRTVLGWLIELACRLADEQVCAFANLTDDGDTGGAAAR
jgi:hypothetical protein